MQRTEEDSYQRLLHRLVQSVRTGSASRALPRQGEPGRVPVVEFVDRMIAEALRLRASDIHIEPFEGAVRIRYRVDGSLLETHAPIPREVHAFLLARLKVMAHLESVERRVAQDGRISYMPPEGGEAVDLRLATLPLLAGEKAVLRILNRSHALLSVGNLGFSVQNEMLFRRLCHQPGGMVLITGPVNSGKTTTLYAALSALNEPSCHIMTLEDPVERRIEGISQFQVNPEAGLTFVAGLRAALRQDAQKILLGEIRDRETAEMAVRIALTGHALFSTLHTEDTVSAVFRMIEMGVPPYLLAATLSGVIAQRLVRRICPHCREAYAVPVGSRAQAQLGDLYYEGLELVRGRGCTHCHGSGYRGRMAIHEILPLSERIRAAILNGRDKELLRRAAMEDGMETLWQDGAAKVLAGETTLAEVERALYG